LQKVRRRNLTDHQISSDHIDGTYTRNKRMSQLEVSMSACNSAPDRHADDAANQHLARSPRGNASLRISNRCRHATEFQLGLCRASDPACVELVVSSDRSCLQWIDLAAIACLATMLAATQELKFAGWLNRGGLHHECATCRYRLSTKRHCISSI
jgi:hypothetical protein